MAKPPQEPDPPHTVALEGVAAATPAESPGGPLLPERYRFIAPIAAGAFGRVLRVWDTVLERRLAMKMLHARLLDQPELVARFVVEGRMTARLQHPGIIAVHDQGRLADGAPWLTMTEVRGDTLAQLIGATPTLSLRRRLQVFTQLCRAVAYAHSEGVVHRDLKPDNLMVGAFGEVVLMDWGLARPIGSESEGLIDAPFSRSPRGLRTRAGAVMGTPAYMAPEQLAGAAVCTAAMDVYALGTILFELITGGRPFSGGLAQLTRDKGSKPAPETAATAQAAGRQAPELPAAMADLCLFADPTVRPQAPALADAVQDWLDGALRREQAQAIVARASALQPEIQQLRGEASALKQRAEDLLDGLSPQASDTERAPAWALEDQHQAQQRQATLLEVDWLQRVRSALALDPELPAAHQALATHYRVAHARAEAAHRTDDALHMEAFLRQHDRGAYAAYLRGDASVSLHTEPQGARVQVSRYVQQGRRLVRQPVCELGPTPIDRATLPHGSYMLTLAAPGFDDTRYPVQLERGGHWDGVVPGESAPRPVRLLRKEELGEDDCYVPAGPFLLGGDSIAPESLPLRRLWVPGFVIRRFPVTHGEYLDFLNALVGRGDLELAERLQPIEHGKLEGSRPVLARGPGGEFIPRADLRGEPIDLSTPVTLVDWHGASAFAAYEGERTGLPWRLPHDLEWEKAARGVDARHYPWGDHAELPWANMVSGVVTPPAASPIRSFPLDESPYRVRGFAGNVRDWCGNDFDRNGLPGCAAMLTGRDLQAGVGEYRMLRGGSWASTPRLCRLAVRYADRPAHRLSVLGLRLARSLSPGPRRTPPRPSSS